MRARQAGDGRVAPVRADHQRAVEGAEILDLEPTTDGADDRVKPRDLRIVDRDVRLASPEDEPPVDRKPLPCERALLHQKRSDHITTA